MSGLVFLAVRTVWAFAALAVIATVLGVLLVGEVIPADLARRGILGALMLGALVICAPIRRSDRLRGRLPRPRDKGG